MGHGLLIAFEGIDGTGKSTQIKMLAARLTELGFTPVVTREPTDGQYGRRLRDIFMHRSSVTPEEELELFIADRREHVESLIGPALAAGSIVLTDRYYLSTAAYQGAAGHDPLEIIRRNESFAPRPDLVLLIKLPPDVAIERIRTLRNETLNDFEQEAGLKKVDDLFDTMKDDYIVRVDGTRSVDEVHRQVVTEVLSLLAEKTQTLKSKEQAVVS